MLRFLFETVLNCFKEKSQYQRPKPRVNPSTKKLALLEHLMSDISPQCNFDINNTIKVIDKCSGDLKLRFAESIHLKLGKQTLNTQERSIPLQIF